MAPIGALARDPEGLRNALRAAFPEAASQTERIRLVHAPGRVNLIGEHTDYNEGYVLPLAIDRGISLALLPTDDLRIEVELVPSGERGSIDLGAPLERAGGWRDYIAGIAWALREAGVAVRGFRAVLASDLPIGAGLSSSAALELASAWALCGGERPPLPSMDLARAAQRAENAFVGVRTGLMDQFAVTFGVEDAALFLDCRTLAHRPVPLPAGAAVVVCDSRVERRLVGSAYDDRRADCERAARALAGVDPSVRSLRDVTPAMLDAHRDLLDPRAYRRARHIVTEDVRVLDTVRALDAGDLAAVGRLLVESHRSLRDDFEVSTPELDLLVEIATATPGVVGARLTGAGFGGCTVNLVEASAIDRLADAIGHAYREWTGLEALVLPVRASVGVGDRSAHAEADGAPRKAIA